MPTRSQIIAGRRLLQRLLPAALIAIQDDTFYAEAVSEISKALATHLTLDKLDAVVIYEGEKGGWHCDVVFRDLPPGFPQVIGSPSKHPFAGRQEAQEHAVRLLTFVVKLIYQQDEKRQKAAPKFEFYDLIFTLQPDVLEMLVAHGIRLNITADGAIAKLKALDKDHGIIDSEATFRALPENIQQLYMARIHMAAATGIFRYPAIEAEAPSKKETQI